MKPELIDHITNIECFTDSVSLWMQNLSVNSLIVFVMMIFMLLGAIDRMRGNKLGYGAAFEEGFQAMGPLALGMAGVVAAAPVLSILLKPVIVPIYHLLGADAAMFAGTILACDTGGYPLAMELASDPSVGKFSGLLLGGMMGPTIIFTIPVALSIIKKEDRPYLGSGVLVGMITIPVGCIAGGLAMNMTPYKIAIGTIFTNLFPVILIAGLIIMGLWFAPGRMIEGFSRFGTGVTIAITFFTAVAVFEYQTQIKFPLFNIMVEEDANGDVPLLTGLLICGQISTILIGAFPMVKWITRHFGRALGRLGSLSGMDENGSAGLVASLANHIPMYNMLGDMNARGKLLNVAFSVSGAFVFGDHLGFTAGVDPEMIFPVVLGKLVAGITALLLANFLYPKLTAKMRPVSRASPASNEFGQSIHP